MMADHRRASRCAANGRDGTYDIATLGEKTTGFSPEGHGLARLLHGGSCDSTSGLTEGLGDPGAMDAAAEAKGSETEALTSYA